MERVEEGGGGGGGGGGEGGEGGEKGVEELLDTYAQMLVSSVSHH